MDSESIARLSCRLDRLEEECRSLRGRCRRWQAGAWGLGLVVATALTVGAARGDKPAESVEARRFVLVGADGATRAVLESEPAGQVGLTFQSGDGARRAKLGLRADGSPILLLHDTASEAGMSLSVSGDRGKEMPQIGLFDKHGAGGIQMVVTEKGTPLIALHDARGVARLSQELTPEGAGALKILTEDQRGVTVGSLAQGDDGVTRVVLKDRDGKVVFQAPSP